MPPRVPPLLSIPLFSSSPGSIWSHQALQTESKDPSSRSELWSAGCDSGKPLINSEPLSPQTMRIMITTSEDFRKPTNQGAGTTIKHCSDKRRPVCRESITVVYPRTTQCLEHKRFSVITWLTDWMSYCYYYLDHGCGRPQGWAYTVSLSSPLVLCLRHFLNGLRSKPSCLQLPRPQAQHTWSSRRP